MAVILTARTKTKANELAKALRFEGLNVNGIKMNVANDYSVASALAEVRRQIGRAEVLINNAAGSACRGEGIANAKLNDSRKLFDRALFGSWAVTKAFLPCS